MLPPLPELPGVTHRYEVVDGVRLHYAEAGEGEPLLLVHGWPEHWWMWRAFIPRLAERFRVIAPDLRGHGWSDKPDGSYEKAVLRDDVLGLLDVLGIERVRWVGHDWGAWTGMLAALERPERIERFVAMSVPHPWRGFDARAAAVTLAYQPIVGGPAGQVAVEHLGFVRLVLRAGRSIGAFSEEEIDVYDSVQRDPDTAAATVRIYRDFMLRELPGLVRGRFDDAHLSVPTLWLVGSEDVIARSGDGYRAHADDMTLETIEGANHFLPEEKPDVVLEKLLAFL
jgi:pimeloyl-ACP methyl ester carboxylesterase